MKKIPYKDIAHLSENQRIKAIADQIRMGRTIAFFTDKPKGDGKKGDRYLKKLGEIIGFKLLGRWDGPTPEAETIKVGPNIGTN